MIAATIEVSDNTFLCRPATAMNLPSVSLKQGAWGAFIGRFQGLEMRSETTEQSFCWNFTKFPQPRLVDECHILVLWCYMASLLLLIHKIPIHSAAIPPFRSKVAGASSSRVQPIRSFQLAPHLSATSNSHTTPKHKLRFRIEFPSLANYARPCLFNRFVSTVAQVLENQLAGYPAPLILEHCSPGMTSVSSTAAVPSV